MNKRIILNIAGMVFLIASFIILIDRYYSIVPEVSIPTTQKLQVLALSLDPSDPLLYNKIHQSYPKSSGGRDTVYTSLYNRKIEVADEIVNDVYAIPRFEKIEIKNISWEEDPYNDVYWRFLFYGFDPEAHLIYAGDEVKTKKGKDKYYGKLLEITNSFVDEGIYKANSWQDPHAVAFRAMILTKAWWKLREENRLSEEESAKILKAIKVHGDFLADEKNYDKGNQNSINEDSALLLLSVSFPDMPRASEWQEIAKKRVGEGLNTLINPEGILIGNSPFYHYYALEKYWSLYKYANNYNINISNDFEGKLLQMVSYGTYILQPNTEIPLIGASIKRKINFAGPYDKLSQLDPAFLYVLTQGKDGKVPTKLRAYPSRPVALHVITPQTNCSIAI